MYVTIDRAAIESAICSEYTATNQEVIDTLIKRELHNVELGAQCADSIGQFKRQILVELVALGYPEDGFIKFDDTEPCYHYYEGDMGFKVSPLFLTALHALPLREGRATP